MNGESVGAGFCERELTASRTHAPALQVLGGGPKKVTMDTVGQHVHDTMELDHPRQERIRQRVLEVVKDADTARKLQAWYPTWCKRACFQDEYLQAFNAPNVELVDTAGKGIDKISENGIVADGTSYPVDLIVWSTGYTSPTIGTPAEKCGMTVEGIAGLSMADKNNQGGLTTLHGVVSRSFPNMFWPGGPQFTLSPNQVFTLGLASSHVANIIATANKGLPLDKHAVIMPSEEGEEAWAVECMNGALLFAPNAGCTPGYFNREGAFDKIQNPEARKMMARMSMWPRGPNELTKLLRDWEAKGDLAGLEITTA